MRAGEDALRRSIALSSDGRARARLRVDLAEVLRARDAGAARAELDQAVREGGATPALTTAALSLARVMPPSERLAWLAGLVREGKTPSPLLVSAVASAQLDAELPRDAARTWLGLARDERVPVHHRRAAIRRAVKLVDRLDPTEAAATRATVVDLAVVPPRRPLRETEANGPSAAPALRSGQASGPLGADGTRPRGGSGPLGADGARARPPSGPLPIDGARNGAGPLGADGGRPRGREGSGPLGADGAARRPRRGRADPAAAWERAVADVRAGQAGRARRRGEEAIRAAAAGPELAARVVTLETALREGGFIKEALRLRRTHLEALDGSTVRPALLALGDEAEQAGLGALAQQWRAEAGVAPAVAPAADLVSDGPEAEYLTAQRRLARDGRAVDVAVVLGHLQKALAGHAGADAALALAESLAARVARDDADLGQRKLDLLRAAHAAELRPSRRARLGRRLAETLEARGDALGAAAVLERALAEAPPGEGERLRAERARLLRTLGRTRELAAALEKDAGALQGDARLGVLAEHATLLEAAGEPEKALDVRLMALAEFPGAPAVLDEARRRLEATGRLGESLALAAAALDHTTDAGRRRQLLRDVATLTAQGGASIDPAGAAQAWLAVLEVDPTDVQAAAAAERFLGATGDWQRSADLLAWLAARAPALEAAEAGREGAPSRGALLWRLAEMRRARLGQPDEALRLYVELRAAGGSPLPPLADPPALAAAVRRVPALAVETARAAAAPSPAERSRALLDRARLLGEGGRRDDAERDGLLAVELDPRNMEALALLERLFEEPARARLLVDELGRRAAKLPPAGAAPLFYGRGRAAARAGDNAAAREAYRRAMALDPTLAEPIAALGALAVREGDWSEVAKLLESELGLTSSTARKGALLLELAVVYGDRLADPARAVALLEQAAAQLRDEPRVLDLRSRFQLAGGNWQAAAEALDQLATRSTAIPGAAERYFAIGAAAEAAGDVDRALTLYSRSYSRDSGYRPTLERLSTICFERGQWDNAWKATEALLERHGPALEPGPRAELLVRSALSDLHVGQRMAAVAKLGEIVTRGPSYSPEAGIRDVAESWAGMHLEPRLLAGVEPRRRERILRRAREAIAVGQDAAEAESRRGPAWEIVGALAVVEGRWEEAFTALETLANEEGDYTPQRRAEFLTAAGDVMAQRYGDRDVAEPYYERARTLWPGVAVGRLGPPPTPSF